MFARTVYPLSGFLICLGMVSGILGSLPAQDASEGPCLPITQLVPHLHPQTNALPVIPGGTYYVPMANKALYRHYAEGLLGRPAENQTELDSMQLTLECGPLFSTINNTGFYQMEKPPRFAQTCLFTAIPSLTNLGLVQGRVNVDASQAVCVGLPATRPDGTVSAVASKSFVTTIDSLIWANEASTVLAIYRCPSDGIKDFKVLTINKTLSADDIATIKTKMAPLGFSESNMAYLNYE